jgi:ribosome-associated protein
MNDRFEKKGLALYPETTATKSKTQRKKEMAELQKLGGKLLTLSKNQLLTLNLSSQLQEAVAQAKKLKKGEALRRQFQHIGALMRTVDPEPIRLLLANIDLVHRQNRIKFQRLELYRNSLLKGDPAIFDQLASEFPQLDRQHLKQLVRNALKERKQEKPPKNFRLIFEYLKNLNQESIQSIAIKDVD